MRLLVTGGAGFIGSHVAEQFRNAGHEVAVLDDLSTGKRSNIPEGVQFYECDIRDPGLESAIRDFKPEVISHHAAQMSVRVSIRHPRRDAQINVEGSINLLDIAAASGVRKIIYASTGGAMYGEPRYLPCDEDHPIVPLSHYGISKHTVEHYLELYSQLYDLDFTVFRYPNVYGPRQDPEGEAGVVAIFIGLMLQDKPVTIYGDGKQARDFVYVGDVARSNVLALERGSRATVNLGSGRGTSVNEIFAALAQATNYRHEPQFALTRVGEVYKIYLTGDLARQRLDWEPLTNFQDGLDLSVAWTRETMEQLAVARSGS
jgi:UDP-glucose 4-epimerase